MEYKALIFDLDGTLVTTEAEYRYLTVGNALRELGTQAESVHIDMLWFESDRDVIIRDFFKVEPEISWPVLRKHELPKLRQSYTRPYYDADFVK